MKYFTTGKTVTFLLVLLLFFPVVSSSVDPDLFRPYVEKSPQGRIDWDEGIIYGVGRGYLKLNKGSKTRALRAAQTIGYGNVLKLAAGVHLDDRHYLESLGSGTVTVDIQGLVKTTSQPTIFVDDPQDPYYEVTMVAPLKGVEGVTAKVVSQLREKPHPTLKPPPPVHKTKKQPIEDGEEAWLVLDARQLIDEQSIRPALFPKIVSHDNSEIYSLAMVNGQALEERGMASYVVSEQALAEDGSLTGDVLRRLTALIEVESALAQDRKKRKKRKRFIVKEVKESQGLNRTNLLISGADAAALQQEDNVSKILENCRVIIIVAGQSGGIEGSLPVRSYALSLP
ncbi:MAG: hypothetical protein ABFS19_13435 [Thermodesulfobacteriota bacterium]